MNGRDEIEATLQSARDTVTGQGVDVRDIALVKEELPAVAEVATDEAPPADVDGTCVLARNVRNHYLQHREPAVYDLLRSPGRITPAERPRVAEACVKGVRRLKSLTPADRTPRLAFEVCAQYGANTPEMWEAIKQAWNQPEAPEQGIDIEDKPLLPKRLFDRAMDFREKHHNYLIRFDGDFFEHNGRIYVPKSEDSLRSSAQRYYANGLAMTEAGPMAADASVRDIVELVEQAALQGQAESTEPTNFWLDGRQFEPLLPVENGLLGLDSGILYPPTPEFFCTDTSAAAFDPSADCPVWRATMESWFPKDPETQTFLQDLFGDLIAPDCAHHYVIVWIGARRGGKGTCAHLIRLLVGAANVAAPRVSTSGETFHLEQFLHKKLAIYGDVEIGSRTDKRALIGDLKTISGHDQVSVPRKNKQAWNGQLGVRLVMLMNQWIDLPDDSGALRARMVPIEFTQTFEGREDFDLLTKLKAELPGILNWALEGRRRIRSRSRYFVIPQKFVALARNMQIDGSQVSRFVLERCTLDPKAEAATELLYRSYTLWCSANGEKDVATRNAFSCQLRNAFRGQITAKDHVQATTDASRPRGFEGIKLNSN